MALEIGAKEAKRLLEEGKAIALDVREREEIEFASIGEHIWIPMHELARRYTELPRGKLIIAVCRSGSRSGSATAFLSSKGLEVKNLKGGIIAWGREVDSKVRPYVYGWEGDTITVKEIKN